MSHKLLRLAVPWALLGILVLSAVLPGSTYRTLFWTQVALYSMTLTVPAMRPIRAFLLLNAAAWLAFWVWLLGRAERSWVKVDFSDSCRQSHPKTIPRTRDRTVLPWIGPYMLQARQRRAPGSDRPVHVLLCIADHFEPRNGNASKSVAMERVNRWVEAYPRLFKDFRDSDGRAPRHTFFYPLEQYDPIEVETLAELCQRGFGEVEVHLHHDGDTAETLRRRLLAHKELLARQHGLLSRHRQTGEIAYGFVHGNWALDNSRPDGRWCGVDNELDVLRETGCYADFTLPSAPDPTQTRQINSIYYAPDDPQRPKSHDRGIAVGAGPARRDALMLIQGPLLLDWHRRKWGLLPRIENGCLQASQRPGIDRLRLWLRGNVQKSRTAGLVFVASHTTRRRQISRFCWVSLDGVLPRGSGKSAERTRTFTITTSPRARCTTSCVPRRRG